MGSALGFGAGLLTALLAGLPGAREAPSLDLVLVAVAVVGVAATTTLPGALAAAAQCWGFWDGFVVN